MRITEDQIPDIIGELEPKGINDIVRLVISPETHSADAMRVIAYLDALGGLTVLMNGNKPWPTTVTVEALQAAYTFLPQGELTAHEGYVFLLDTVRGITREGYLREAGNPEVVKNVKEALPLARLSDSQRDLADFILRTEPQNLFKLLPLVDAEIPERLRVADEITALTAPRPASLTELRRRFEVARSDEIDSVPDAEGALIKDIRSTLHAAFVRNVRVTPSMESRIREAVGRIGTGRSGLGALMGPMN